MKLSSKTLLALAGPALALSAPAAAQRAPGIAVANPTAIVVQSNAYKTAETQRAVTYKAQFDQVNTRRSQIEAQLRPLASKFESDARAANPNQASLQQQYTRLQEIEASGQQELNQLMGPVTLSRAYVIEQISDRLEAATRQAMARQKVTLLLDSQSVINADQTYNLNQAILNELNTLIPAAQLVPPQGWLPRAQREQQAAGAAPAQGQQPRPAAPGGR